MALVRGGLRERRVGTAVTGVPTLGSGIEAGGGQGPDTAEAEVLGDLAYLRLLVGVERVVTEGVRRDQPRVVVLHREQITGREVAGLDPVAVGHPGGRDDRRVTGNEDDLVDGHRRIETEARAVERGHGDERDRPVPPDVALAGTGEQVGHDARAGTLLDHMAEVFSDVSSWHVGQERGAGLVDGSDGRRIGVRGRDHGPHLRPQAPQVPLRGHLAPPQPELQHNA